MKKIGEIKDEFLRTEITDIPQLIKVYENDDRAGVCNIVKSYAKKYDKYLKEQQRLEALLAYEKSYYEKGIELIAGIDEVGRGPLAGPVVTAAVILPKGCKIEGVNDSKKLSAKKREELYDIITEAAITYYIGVCDNHCIDEYNILRATYMAMQQSVKYLSVRPQQLLVDAVTIPGIDIPQQAIIKGDALSMSIGAASIVAKVTRDRMMQELALEYPQYDFENNMGYGTAKHIEALKKYGPCPIHRKTFIKNLL